MKKVTLKTENLSTEGQAALKRVTAANFGLAVAANLAAIRTLQAELARIGEVASSRFGEPTSVCIKTTINNRTVSLTPEALHDLGQAYVNASNSLMEVNAIRLGLAAAPAWQAQHNDLLHDLDWSLVEIEDVPTQGRGGK